MIRVLFVCMANICRSPMAESVARSLAESEGMSGLYEFDSAGTVGHFSGQPPDDRARQIVTRHGYTMTGIKARTITLRDFERFDLILAMDRKIFFSLHRICPLEHRGKLQLFLAHLPDSTVDEVPDPYYGNLDGFEHVLDLCEKTTRALLAKSSPMNISQLETEDVGGFLRRIKQLLGRRKE